MSDKVHPMRLDHEHVIQALPQRAGAAHKGDHGHVGIVGAGEVHYSGAVCLAGEAALRAGAGLVSAVVAPSSLVLMARAPAELMCYGLADPAEMSALIGKVTTWVLGSGLTQNKWAKAFFQALLKTDQPLIVDADGLNLLAQFPSKRQNWILTPHLGEAARLLNMSVAQVQQDKIAAALQLQQRYGGVIVLKGAGTVIVGGTEPLFVNEGEFPILAVGGTGDVLAGMIGALVAQGLSLLDAAKIGVSVHTRAALQAQTLGERGMLASDLFVHLRQLLNPVKKI